MSGIEVVISYRREDQGDAGRLGELLASHFGRDRVFVDTTTIRPGQQFPAVIAEAIRECSAVVALITPRWREGLEVEDDWVRRELREAFAAGRPIVPVLMHGNAAPRRSELPEELRDLADLHAQVLSDADFRDDMGSLVRVLEGGGAEPAPRRAFTEIPETAKVEVRAAWDSPDAPEEVRRQLEATLASREIRVTGEEGDALLLKGGNKMKAQFKGLVAVSELMLPLKGRLRLRDSGAAVSIEVLLEADPVFFATIVGVSGRFSTHFERTIDALRQVTERR